MTCCWAMPLHAVCSMLECSTWEDTRWNGHITVGFIMYWKAHLGRWHFLTWQPVTCAGQPKPPVTWAGYHHSPDVWCPYGPEWVWVISFQWCGWVESYIDCRCATGVHCCWDRIETCLLLSKVVVVVRHHQSEVTDKSRTSCVTRRSRTRRQLSRRWWEIYSTRHWWHTSSSSSMLTLRRRRGTTSCISETLWR